MVLHNVLIKDRQVIKIVETSVCVVYINNAEYSPCPIPAHADAVTTGVEDDDEAVEENWHTPQPLGALRPVFCTSHVWRLPSAQNEPWTAPVRPVLFDSVRIWRGAGNVSGSGVERLLESRCSSTSEEREDIEEGMTPEIDVEERSLNISLDSGNYISGLRRTVASTRHRGMLIGTTVTRGCSNFGR